MDPYTAVAVAGNILQFVQFVGDLLNNTSKIYASAAGITVENEHVQDICRALIEFDDRLQPPLPSASHQLPPGVRTPAQTQSSHGRGILDCAAACRADCQILIQITEKVKAKSSGSRPARYWASFRAALSEVWKSSEIEELRRRIAERQRVMTLQLCAVSSETLQVISKDLKQLDRKCSVINSARDSRLAAYFWKVDHMQRKISSLERQGRAGITADGIERICDDISNLTLDTRQYAKEAAIIASLNYGDRPLRHEKIPEAHAQTFGWSLLEPTEAALCDMTPVAREQSGWFRKWLSGTSDGLFWVSGRPGSGKSTFMKYISDSGDATRLLMRWSGPRRLLAASHYFTIYGTPIQRSLEGLLRSLLYGIMQQEPRLIAEIAPHRLDDTWATSGQTGWTQRELEDALERVHEKMDTLQLSVCFFVDGLDEYAGDHFEICRTLKQLSTYPYIKICVSSRPWNVFEDALGTGARETKLYMHELTHTDIRNYTECVMHEHPRWKELEEEPSSIPHPSLVDEVVSKANGVFLWVNLVTRFLREGLTNGDSMSDLRKRLSVMPSDLKPFFQHILDSVDTFYAEKMAGTLLLALRAERPLAIELYMLHDIEYDDEDYAFKSPTALLPTDLQDVFRRFDLVSRRINGRCKGMLERNGDRIEFFHRTVYDFLKTTEMEEYLRGKAKRNFSPGLSLFRAYVAWITRSIFLSGPRQTASSTAINFAGSDATTTGNSDDCINEEESKRDVISLSGFIRRLQEALFYARDTDQESQHSSALTRALLDNIETVGIPTMLSREQILSRPATAIGIYRLLILKAGVKNYVRKKLENDLDYLRCKRSDVLGPLLEFDYRESISDLIPGRRQLGPERNRATTMVSKRVRQDDEDSETKVGIKRRSRRKRKA